MKYVKRVLVFHPQATKIRNSQEDLDHQLALAALQKTKSKLRTKTESVFKSIRIFVFGTYLETYVKPQLTKSDCFFMLIHLHTNIRFIVLYIDLTLEWGGFLVWIVFSCIHILICPCLAFLYTFFGEYGSRSFLSLWDLMPFLQGISACMIVFEAFKLLEMSVIVTSGILSIPLYLSLKGNDTDAMNYNLNCTDQQYHFRPGWAVPYGISEKFTLLGYNNVSNAYAFWKVNHTRSAFLGIVWITVIVIRLFQYKRYRVIPIRIIPISMSIMFGLLLTTVIIQNQNAVDEIVHSELYNYGKLSAYLQIFAFAVSDYLPGHWVTIGYMKSSPSMDGQIWTISFTKILLTFLILYGIPLFAQDFQEYTHVPDGRCLHFFGLHFVFIVVPLTIHRSLGKYFHFIVYLVYIFLIISSGICYILINIELISLALSSRGNPLLYRFRNLLFIAACLILYGLSVQFCINSAHFALFFLNFKSHYLSNVALLMLTVIGFGCYGLDRINADHHFLVGTVFNHMKPTKLLLIVCTAVLIIHVINVATYDYRLETNDLIYWLIHGICVVPILFGSINACAHKRSYHSLINPLLTWGRPTEMLRIGRRRKTLRQMYLYRTRRICNHTCLLNNEALKAEVQKELVMNRSVLIDDPELVRKLMLDSMYKKF